MHNELRPESIGDANACVHACVNEAIAPARPGVMLVRSLFQVALGLRGRWHANREFFRIPKGCCEMGFQAKAHMGGSYCV